MTAAKGAPHKEVGDDQPLRLAVAAALAFSRRLYDEQWITQGSNPWPACDRAHRR
jgi:hypothetical protein